MKIVLTSNTGFSYKNLQDLVIKAEIIPNLFYLKFNLYIK